MMLQGLPFQSAYKAFPCGCADCLVGFHPEFGGYGKACSLEPIFDSHKRAGIDLAGTCTALDGKAAAIAILVLGILLIAAGVFRGELDVILKKAAVVCMECIGLG